MSSHIKGAQTRSLTHALLKVFERHGRVDPAHPKYSEHDHEVFVVLKHLAMLNEIIMKDMVMGKWRYSAQDLKDMTDAIQKGATMYRRLAHTSMAGDGPAWMQKVGATMGNYFQASPCAPHVRRVTVSMLAHGMVLHERRVCWHAARSRRIMPPWLASPQTIPCNRR